MASTIVKKVTVGVPLTGVTSGAFAIDNLGGVDVAGVGEGDMLVYNASQSKFFADSDTYMKTTDSAEVKAMFSAGGDLSYNQGTGQFSFDVETVYTKANFDSDLGAAVVTFADGSAAEPSIANTGDTNTGIHFPAADTIGLSTGGTSQLTIADGVIAPVTDNDIDLGTSSLEFKDAFFDGTVTTDALVADTADINAGTIDATVIGGSTAAAITGTTITGTSFTIGSAVINEAELETIDTITAGTVAASKAVVVDANKDITGYRNITLIGELDAASADIEGDLDVNGTTNLDAVDIDGAVQIDATLTVGADDQGYDVTLHGDTASAKVTWDTSADDLILSGAAGLVVPDGQLTLGSTALTSTATELNLLDNVSGLVQADFTKLAAVDTTAAELNLLNSVSGLVKDDLTKLAAVDTTAAEINLLNNVSGLVKADLTKLAAVDATAAEINIVDGDTSASAITVVDADRVVMNDDGTMKQVAVTDLAAYLDDEITAMPNLVSVGALNTGSITSGFTSIDVGAGAISTTGVGTFGSLDINGAVQIDGTLSVGVNDQGYDVTLYGDTAGAKATWDTSADDLILSGAAGLVVPDGQLTLGSTAVTSTATELNLLDNVSGLIQADFTKLAAVDATAAELNIIDGGTSASSTTVVDADRVVMNDDGTMKQVAVTDLAAYFDDEITAMPNLVTTAATTVGALNAGSITSGFTSIDVGAGAITTTGVGTFGSLDIEGAIDVNGLTNLDEVDIDGAVQLDATLTVGANDQGYDVTLYGDTASAKVTWDTSADDLILSGAAGLIVPDGQLTLGSTALTSTAAELNILDGVTSTAAELNILDGDTSASSTTVADGDRIVLNDAGTMKQVAVTDLAAYIDDEITKMPNLISTGALDSGSITAGFGAIDNGTSGIRTATFTAETAFVPSASDGAALGTSSLEFSDIFLADGAVISLGDDDDVTLTHIPDAGIRLNSTMALQFNDQTQFINAPTNEILDITATAEVELNATLVDVNANLDVSGTYTGAGLMTTGGNIVIPDGGTIGVASDTDVMTIAANGITTFSKDVVIPNLTVSGTQTISNTVTMTAENAIVFEGATADAHETTLSIVDPTADHFYFLPNLGNTPDSAYIAAFAVDPGTSPLITSSPVELNKLDGVTATTAQINNATLTTSTTAELNIMDGDTSAITTTVADGDRVVLNDAGTMKQVAVTDLSAYFDDEITAMPNLVSTGALDGGTITAGFGAIDNGTSGIRTNTFTAETSVVPSAQDGAALGTTSLQFSDIFLADGAVIGMGDDNEVTLTHVPDTGILLNGTNVIQFNDASQSIGAPTNEILDINATAEIELNATLVDVNANMEVSGTITGNLTGNVTGNTSGTALTVTQAAQTAITSLGTLTALTVDNIGIDGNTITANSGALNLTPAGGSAIVLDGTINVDAGVVTGATSVTSTAFVGDLTGDVTGNASGTALTVTQAAQTAITSLGTLTALTVDNLGIDGNTITANSGAVNITPAGGSAIVLDGTINVDAGVVTGATSVTSTAFVGDLTGDVTGNASGTALTVTQAAQTAITSLGTLTALTVDNLGVNGNTITANSGALNLTPASGSAIVLDGAINVDAGVVTGATSITSTAFVGDITGDVTGNASGTAATVTGAAQSAITSLGTLTTLTVDNVIINGATIGHTSDTDLMTVADGALTVAGNIAVTGTVDGVDIATRDGILSSTTTTAGAALPKAGGAMTGAITTNSTFDGVDIATRDGVLTSTTTTANAALPKTGGAMTGAITTNSTFDGRDVATDGSKLDGIEAGATADQSAAQIKTHLENGIDSVHYVDGSIDTDHIGDDQVTAAKLANSINTDIATGVTGNTTANAALPKAGGAMTGAITTNSTFDGVDIATRDGVLTSTTTTANAALPKAGGTMSGDLVMDANEIHLADNGEIRLGTAADMKIYHDGSHSYILDNGTGALKLKGDDIRFEDADGNNILKTTATATELYHSGTKKLETAAAGIVISGSNTSTNVVSSMDGVGLQLQNTSDTNGNFAPIDFVNAGGTLTARMGAEFQDAGDRTTDLFFATRANSGALTEQLRITSAGAATFSSDVSVGALFKMPTNTAAKILVADGTSFQECSMSGDATIASGGAVTIAADAIGSGELDNVQTLLLLDEAGSTLRTLYCAGS